MEFFRRALPGASLHLACFLRSGVARAKQLEPLIVFLGARMAGRETFAAIQELLQHTKRVIVVSRTPNRLEAERALRAGAFRYYVIGGDGALLAQEVRAALWRPLPRLSSVPLLPQRRSKGRTIARAHA